MGREWREIELRHNRKRLRGNEQFHYLKFCDQLRVGGPREGRVLDVLVSSREVGMRLSVLGTIGTWRECRSSNFLDIVGQVSPGW